MTITKISDSTCQGLLADILEHPDDDTPRLILADYLTDHGEPERAEYIRLECKLASPVSDQSSSRLLECLRHLRIFNHERFMGWCHPLSLLGSGWTWFTRRGFVYKLYTTWIEWQKHGPMVVRCQPVEVVHLTDWSMQNMERAPGFNCWMATYPEPTPLDGGHGLFLYPREWQCIEALSQSALRWAVKQPVEIA